MNKPQSDIPFGWEKVRLEDIVMRVVGGGTPSRKVYSYFQGNIPWFTVKDMKELKPGDSLEHITPEAIDESATNLIPANTISLATRIALGKAIKPSIDYAINQDLKALFLPKGVHPDFILYWIVNNERKIQELGSGTTVLGIRLETLNALDILLPPEKEQIRIVEKLEELLSDLDDGVAELKAAQTKLTQYRQSLLKSAVEGSLTAEWRAKNKSTETGEQLLKRILAERRKRWEKQKLAEFEEKEQRPPKDWQKKYPEPVAPDTSELPELPEGWVWASFGQLGLVQLGRQRSPAKLRGANPVRYIRAANITERGVDLGDILLMDFSEKEIATFKLEEGDVLLTEASGSPEHVGRPCIWPGTAEIYCFQNTVIRFKPTIISSEFSFLLCLANQKLGKYIGISGGVGINHLSAGKFSGLLVPLPPLEEQDVIYKKYLMESAKLDEQFGHGKQMLLQAEVQRKNILKDAFRGRLVEQDPLDEPASLLLQRIKAERRAFDKQPKTRKFNGLRSIEVSAVKMLEEFLKEKGTWVSAQDAFKECGVSDGAEIDVIEEMYAELRRLDKKGRLAVKREGSYDKIKYISDKDYEISGSNHWF